MRYFIKLCKIKGNGFDKIKKIEEIVVFFP